MKQEVTHERGVNAILMKSWLEQNHQSEFETICGKLSEAARDMLTSPATNQWYPVELMKEIYAAVFEVLSPDNPRILADYGYFAAERSASGLLKYLMRFIDM
ncbi:hypothetical protein GF359_08640, partial [candidate division WOR-3 bacterium]|nr:hypothetical protein [candidate division WOR-3 bacterium]MBD3365267.1 hypothetical protein [candidate division WOR-3 bacterium]